MRALPLDFESAKSDDKYLTGRDPLTMTTIHLSIPLISQPTMMITADGAKCTQIHSGLVSKPVIVDATIFTHSSRHAPDRNRSNLGLLKIAAPFNRTQGWTISVCYRWMDAV